MTIAHDQLSHGLNDVHYGTVAAAVPGAEPRSLVAGEPGPAPDRGGGGTVLFDGAGRDRRFRAGDPHRAAAARAADRAGGARAAAAAGCTWCVRATAFRGRAAASAWSIGEDKLLTAGGFYSRTAEYAALMREAIAANPTRRAALDYSVSYDYGAEINAFAKCYAVAAAEPVVPSAAARLPTNCGPCSTGTSGLFRRFVSGHHQGKQHDHVAPARLCDPRRRDDVPRYRRGRVSRDIAAAVRRAARFRGPLQRCRRAAGLRVSLWDRHPSLGLRGRPQRLVAGADAGGSLSARPADSRRRSIEASPALHRDDGGRYRPAGEDRRGVDQHRRRAWQPLYRKRLLELQRGPGLAAVRGAPRHRPTRYCSKSRPSTGSASNF